MSEAIKKLVEYYVHKRDEKRKIAERQKKELEPINVELVKIEQALHAKLMEMGAQNIKTEAGTAYFTTTTKASIEDWGAFKDWAVEHDMLDALEHRISNKAVEEFVEAHGELMPGVSIQREKNLRIKR